MAMPTDIGVVDTMMGLPRKDKRWWMKSFGSMVRDAESRASFQHAADYMFKDLPEPDLTEDPVQHLVREMDRFNIARSLIPIHAEEHDALRAIKEHPDRF